MPSLCDYFITNACNAKFLISSLIGAYVAYYFFVARSSPVLYGHSRKLVDFFHSYVPFLNEVYSPFVFGFTGRVQTILRPIFHRVEKVNYEKEVISFSDGGDMTLSWSNIEGMADDTPIVALLPGLAGCGCCHYIASIVKEINRCKYRCVILNNRGGCRRKLKPPVLYGHSRKLVDFFCSYVPFLSEVYSPFVFGFTGRVQTILRPIFHRAEKCNYEEEVISFSDGGDMTLSWSNIEGMADDTPIAVLLPGLTGCGCCHYIASLVKEINRCEYRCVVSNNRGTCRHKLKTPRTYCAAHTSDVASVFDHIRNRYPDAPMVAVGISLGALLVFNYLADEPQDPSKPCPLTAAMCVCMPWDVSQTSDKLEKSLDWLLFNYPLTHGLRRLVMRNADVLSKKYDVPRILKVGR
ncbi:Abhydrolase domain-containing protein 3 [Echinococcus granulosus]|uniref:Abhydrolase domain-containing protein 3 n=1 Tax=Echinococcus granulosus TaxID=6210 RepID=W6UW04_ECHGR|nr:Abhydrolase domain-containing protein 3 [Echinococcus granulosus]EUB57654.1 Abhydrolase domain-containing protein 3 [Echinococcus granulosus]